MTPSATDTQYADLVTATGGERLSMSDMLREYYTSQAGQPADNDYSLSDLLRQSGGGPVVATITNLIQNPTPASATNWTNTNGAAWVHSYVAGTIEVNRQAGAPADVADYVINVGLPAANPTLKVGVNYQRSIDIWVDATAFLLLLDPDGFVGGQTLVANQWTTVVQQFTGKSTPMFCMAFGVNMPGVGTGVHMKMRKAFLAENPSGQTLLYADGGSSGWVWNGTANASTSTGPIVQTPVVQDLIAALFAKTTFTVGHRGSGDVWPEHTADSYAGAFADASVNGLEFSIQRNDTGGSGQWFHLHDIGATGLDRTTNITGDPKALTDATINSGIKVDIGPGAFYLNPANYPNVPKFLDEMAKYFGKTVLFLETKDYSVASTNALLDLLDASFPEYQKSVIFKTHWGNIARAADARARGMKTWIYLDDPLSIPALDSIMPVADYIGVPVSPLVAGGMTDAELQTVVARGKPVISWSVPHRFVRDRLKVGGSGGVGLQGFVSSMAPYTASSVPLRTRDNFASGKWSAGDLPYDNTRSFTLDIANACAHFGGMASNPSVTLGSMCPVPATATIEYECRFLTLPTDLTTHLGFFFGKLDDQRYQFQVANVTQGYHAIMRANGNMQLYRHDIGVTTGVSLAGPLLTAVAVAGTWMKFRIIITPTTLSYQRIDAGGGAALTSSDTTLRGRYFGISRNYALSGAEGPGTVEFKNIIVT